MNGSAGKPMSCTVKLNPDQYKRIDDYCTIMNIPIESALHEALEDFIQCCVSTRLESYQKKLHIA